jgi:aspartyl-tRNA(Asn)/glutamyl-tRNA(Gln) amidotransferase subunit B
LRLEADHIARLRDSLAELPDRRKQRYITSYALPEYDAGLLSQSQALGAFFEATAAAAANPKAASNWIMGELSRKMNEEGIGIDRVPIAPAALGELIRLIDGGTITGATAKVVFEKMYATGRSAPDIVAAEGLGQIADEDQLRTMVRKALEDNPGPVEQLRGGKTAALGFLVGQVMKAAGGKVNAKRVNQIIKELVG